MAEKSNRVEVEIRNGDLRVALEAMVILASSPNRLDDTIDSLKAHRNRKRMDDAYEPVEETRKGLVDEHGKEEKKGAGKEVAPGTPGMKKYVAAFQKLMDATSTVVIEKLSNDAIEDGWSRDPETGKRGPLEISASEIGALADCGVLDNPDADEEEKPEKKGGKR